MVEICKYTVSQPRVTARLPFFAPPFETGWGKSSWER